MDHIVHTETYNNHTIEIFVDCDTQNPFTEMDMLSTAYYYGGSISSPSPLPYPRYNTIYNFERECGIYMEDFHNYENMSEAECLTRLFKEASKDYIILFFDYDYNIVSDYNDNNGIIFVSKEDVRKAYNVKRISKKTETKAINVLTSEMSIYKSWVDGEIYGFNIPEIDESCGGFIGDIKFAIEAAKETI